jgi:hypothetical protein
VPDGHGVFKLQIGTHSQFQHVVPSGHGLAAEHPLAPLVPGAKDDEFGFLTKLVLLPIYFFLQCSCCSVTTKLYQGQNCGI